MEIEGVVHNGVIVPDDATALLEGMRGANHRNSDGKAKNVR